MPTTDEARLLLELSRRVTATLDLQEVLDHSLAALRRLLDFDGGSIQLIEDGNLRLVAADPPAPPEVYAYRLPVGHGFGGRVAATGEPVYSADATVDVRADPEGRAKASVPGVRSYLAVPLIVHGEVIGITQIDSPVVDAFSVDAQNRVLAFVPTISAAVQNALLYNQEREALQRLQEAERLKHDFIAVVSHELRTPLTTVTGFAATLRTRASQLSADRIADFGARIESAGRRLGLLIGDLLDLSGIQRRTIDVEFAAVDVGEALREVVDELMSDRQGIVVTVEDGLPRVRADADRLVQVMWKVIDNARRFSPPTAPVRVDARRDGADVVVTVSDEGRGIPPELLERVFEPFFQVEDALTRSTGGLGTGLYLAREIARAMDAELTVESTLGRGSRFTLRLATAP